MWGKSFDGTHATGAAATGVEGLRTIVPISGDLLLVQVLPGRRAAVLVRRPERARQHGHAPGAARAVRPLRQQIATNAGEGTVPPETAGNFNAFWDERDYENDGDQVQAAVFVVHGLNDYNVKPNNYDEWWDNLAANDVPRKIWLTQTGHVDPFDFDRADVGRDDPPLVRLLAPGHRQRVMDEPLARIEQQPNLVGQTPAFKTLRGLPGSGRGADAALAALASAAGGPGAAVARQAADGRDREVDRPARAVHRAHARQRAADREAGDRRADRADNPNRLVALSPPLTKGVRISGRSSVTLRLSADQADAALGAVLVDYGDAPFEAIDYRNADGVFTSRTSRRSASARTPSSTTGATSASPAGTGPRRTRW